MHSSGVASAGGNIEGDLLNGGWGSGAMNRCRAGAGEAHTGITSNNSRVAAPCCGGSIAGNTNSLAGPTMARPAANYRAAEQLMSRRLR